METWKASVRPDYLWADSELESTPTLLYTSRHRVKPPPPSLKGRPRMEVGPKEPKGAYRPPSRAEDPDLWRVRDALLKEDPEGIRVNYALREALDQIYDGQRTGRWDYTQLSKTEKTHVGTLVELWLQREFAFPDGVELDFSISGVDVDCKWSLNLYDWEIPLEMYSRGDKIALVVWANEYSARWALGLVRVGEDVLRPAGRQRDGKRRLSPDGRDRILWVHDGKDLLRNTLLHIQDEQVRNRIVYAHSGQGAVNSLFRELQGILVNRATVLTVAQQVDAAKRVRDARWRLRREGIVIFGHYVPHPEMAETLGLPPPILGSFVSTRLAPWEEGDPEPYIELEGGLWRRARDNDREWVAPALPRQGLAV